MPNVVGVNLGATRYGKRLQDGGACIISTGKGTFAQPEERFSGIKHDAGFERSLQFGLDFLDIASSEIDCVVMSTCCEEERVSGDGLPGASIVTSVNHHYSHALLAYHTSRFKRAIVLVLDSGGNVLEPAKSDRWWEYRREQHSYFLASPNGVELIERDCVEPRATGVGEVVRAFTYYMGWHSGALAGNTMAAAGAFVGKPLTRDRIFEISDGRITSVCGNSPREPFEIVHKILRGAKIEDPGPNPRGTTLRTIDFALANWLQSSLEHILCAKVSDLMRRTGVRNVCLGGGVAYNCPSISAILENTAADAVHVSWAPGDHGQCIGNAIHGHQMLKSKYQSMHALSPYLGREQKFSLKDIQKYLGSDRRRYHIHRSQNIASQAAYWLAKGQVVAWFQGRSESGPRALGNRSLLLDPRSSSSRARVNRIKERPTFMPVAPAALVEEASTYFSDGVSSPFMERLFRARNNESRAAIPAAFHLDGTARLQTVSKEQNPLFYELISEFGSTTGTPVVLNTSFNTAGQPIVENVEEAIRTFRKMDIECGAFGRFLVRRKDAFADADWAAKFEKTWQLFELNPDRSLEERRRDAMRLGQSGSTDYETREKFSLYEPYFKWWLCGRKITTIRCRVGSIEIPVTTTLPLVPTKNIRQSTLTLPGVDVRIVAYGIKRFCDLDEEDACRDGFESLKQLRDAMIKIYGSLAPEEFMTIYFIVDAQANLPRAEDSHLHSD